MGSSRPIPRNSLTASVPNPPRRSPSSFTASRRMSRTSSSIDRPWRAARRCSLRLIASSRLRTISWAMLLTVSQVVIVIELWNSWFYPQFLNWFLWTDVAEPLRNLGAHSVLWFAFIVDRTTQDFADLLHRPAVAGGAPLQLALDRIVEVANNQLSHEHLTCYHDSMSWEPSQGRETHSMNIKVG